MGTSASKAVEEAPATTSRVSLQSFAFRYHHHCCFTTNRAVAPRKQRSPGSLTFVNSQLQDEAIAGVFKRRAAAGLIQLSDYETFEEALNAIQQRAPERREGRDAEYYLPYSDDQGAGKDYKWNEANFSALLRFVYSQAEQGRHNVIDGIWDALDLPSEENDKGADAEVDIAKLKEVPYPEGDAFRALLAASAFHVAAAVAS